METDYTMALAGNPNSGKTTMFNVLTGKNQRVGNFPGVTMDRLEGFTGRVPGCGNRCQERDR